MTALLESMAALYSVGENNQWASTYLGLVHHSVTLNLSCVQLYSHNSCTAITAGQFTVEITLRYFAPHAHSFCFCSYDLYACCLKIELYHLSCRGTALSVSGSCQEANQSVSQLGYPKF